MYNKYNINAKVFVYSVVLQYIPVKTQELKLIVLAKCSRCWRCDHIAKARAKSLNWQVSAKVQSSVYCLRFILAVALFSRTNLQTKISVLTYIKCLHLIKQYANVTYLADTNSDLG